MLYYFMYCTLGGTAGEVVNPDKTRTQVDEESKLAHEKYVLSHNDYYVGEMYDRK